VWALNGAYVNSNPTEGATCKLILTTRYDNPNLHAQDGLFTLAGPAPGSDLALTDLPRIDDILSDVAAGSLPARVGALPMPNPIMRKFVLARDQDAHLMSCLRRRRVMASRIFPGLAGVAMTIRERTQFGVKGPSF
jgi:hypothetical protein